MKDPHKLSLACYLTTQTPCPLSLPRLCTLGLRPGQQTRIRGEDSGKWPKAVAGGAPSVVRTSPGLLQDKTVTARLVNPELLSTNSRR